MVGCWRGREVALMAAGSMGGVFDSSRDGRAWGQLDDPPVELSQPRDSSKVAVVLKLFWQARSSEGIVRIECCG